MQNPPLAAPARGLAAAHAVEHVAGPSLVDDLGPQLDELHVASRTPVTARRTWLRAWVSAYEPAHPWAVAVRDEGSGRLDGVALVCHRPRDGWDEVVPLGRRQQDRGWLPARSPAAAEALAAAVAARLQSWPRPWALRLGQLPARDPVATGILRRLPHGRLVPGVAVPKVEFASGRGVEPYLGKSLRKQLRKSCNRVEQAGLSLDVRFDRDHHAVTSLLDEVERTHRARERHARRTSDLESQRGLRFWRGVICDHAARGEIELATVRIAGALAAYVVSLLDGGEYRVFDGRFATAWARFSPGRLLEAAVLERALGDGRFERLDWMNGCASEKLLTANGADATAHLVAWSPGLVLDLADLELPSPTGPTPQDGADAVSLASSAR